MVQTDGTPLIYDRESTPLWMPRYDGVANMDFFVPFGNWTAPYMKQYSGGSNAARRAQYTVNENYIDDSFYDLDGLNTTTVYPI